MRSEQVEAHTHNVGGNGAFSTISLVVLGMGNYVRGYGFREQHVGVFHASEMAFRSTRNHMQSFWRCWHFDHS